MEFSVFSALPTVKFDQSSYSVLEGDGIVEVTIVMDLTTL